MAIENVVGLNNESVYGDIMTFIDSRKSENTKKGYSKAIADFFMYMTGKELNQLTEEDLHFKHTQIIKYQKHLKRKFKNATVNNKINAIRSLFKFLKRNEYNVKPEAFEVDHLSTDSAEKIGFLSYDEAKEMIELAKDLTRGEMKSLLLEMAVYTSIRLEALLSLKWKDIKNENGTWVVHAIDKGEKKDKKPITGEYYERLLTLKNDKSQNDLIFDIKVRQVQIDIRKLCEVMKIEDERNISFHSLKKVAVNWILQETGDVIAATKQGNHSSIHTMYNHYADMKQDYSQMAGIMMCEDVEIEGLEEMSQEDLVRLIKMSSNRTKNELKGLIEKL